MIPRFGWLVPSDTSLRAVFVAVVTALDPSVRSGRWPREHLDRRVRSGRWPREPSCSWCSFWEVAQGTLILIAFVLGGGPEC